MKDIRHNDIMDDRTLNRGNIYFRKLTSSVVIVQCNIQSEGITLSENDSGVFIKYIYHNQCLESLH